MKRYHDKPLPHMTNDEIIVTLQKTAREANRVFNMLRNSRERAVRSYSEDSRNFYEREFLRNITSPSYIRRQLETGKMTRNELLQMTSKYERWLNRKTTNIKELRKIYEKQRDELNYLGYTSKDPKEIRDVYRSFYEIDEGIITDDIENMFDGFSLSDIPSDIKNEVSRELKFKRKRVDNKTFLTLCAEKIDERQRKRQELEDYWKSKQTFF